VRSDPRLSPALRVKPAPVGIKGDLATLGCTASFRSAGLPCHARVSLSGEGTHELGASRREKRRCVE
jgi:hypothetical protein